MEHSESDRTVKACLEEIRCRAGSKPFRPASLADVADPKCDINLGKVSGLGAGFLDQLRDSVHTDVA